jgi:hypothetical protein
MRKYVFQPDLRPLLQTSLTVKDSLTSKWRSYISEWKCMLLNCDCLFPDPWSSVIHLHIPVAFFTVSLLVYKSISFASYALNLLGNLLWLSSLSFFYVCACRGYNWFLMHLLSSCCWQWTKWPAVQGPLFLGTSDCTSVGTMCLNFLKLFSDVSRIYLYTRFSLCYRKTSHNYASNFEPK